MMDFLHVKWWLIALLAVVAIAAPAHAQTFPSKTIRIIVPYRGGAPAAVAIASGEVPLGMTDTAAILPMISSGQIVALGVAEPVRSQSMPNIPTLREAGVPNFSAMSWLALFAPRGTPDDRVVRLNAEIAKILAMPEAHKVLFTAGLETAPSSPSEMRRIVEADHKKWGQFIKVTGFKAQ